MSGYKDSIVYVITHDVRAQDYDEFIEAKPTTHTSPCTVPRKETEYI